MTHIIYTDRFFTTGCVEVREARYSKVYGEYSKRFPSGLKTMVKVWNPRVNKIVSIRKDDIIKVVD
jgi:hypothetical protein